jgi:hypothetical protein
MIAVKIEAFSIIKLLLENNADINIQNDVRFFKNNSMI